jgi:hypothetical protein
MDKPGQEFVIRMKSGLWYQRMEQGQVMGVVSPHSAFKFKSRMAALQVCAITHDFAGAYIMAYNPPETQPEAQ